MPSGKINKQKPEKIEWEKIFAALEKWRSEMLAGCQRQWRR